MESLDGIVSFHPLLIRGARETVRFESFAIANDIKREEVLKRLKYPKVQLRQSKSLIQFERPRVLIFNCRLMKYKFFMKLRS